MARWLCVAVALVAIPACGSPSSTPPSGARTQLQPPVYFDAARIAPTTISAPGPARVRITIDPPPPAAALRAGTSAIGAASPAETAARWHLARRADELGLDAATLASAEVTLVHDLGHGPIVVKLGQRVGGLPVIRTSLALVMDRSLGLVAITGELAPVAPAAAAPAFTLTPTDALGRAIADTGATPRVLRPEPDHAGYQRFTADGLLSPARVRRVLFPVGGQLVAAYQSELLFAGSPMQGYRHVVAADDGRLLYRTGTTLDAVHSYRVWADPTGDLRPLDGPVADYTPHPTGIPDGFQPAFIAPSLIAVDGLNTAPGGGTDPWLPAGATVTTGNNADAYADLDGIDGFSGGDIRADVTSPGVFDRTYDTAAEPDASTNQIKASVAVLFYINNWLHDWWYDSGFTEAAGNAQTNNYGRGGVGGDPLLVEAQDSSGTDNANMNTPADGASPRMQMYLWSAAPGGARPDGTIDTNIVTHEYGHYLHLRLVDCGSQACYAMSEGWADFDAALMNLRPGDDLDGVYGLGAYALQSFTQNAAYFGIRRYPYSRDFSKNPLTFRHMHSGEPLPIGPAYTDVNFLQGADNWEVHDAGEIWCSMLFTGLADLLAQSLLPSPRFTWNEGRRRYADYVVAGMIAAPVEPDFTAQRDAILAVALATDVQDFVVLAAAYAKRGFGTGAVSPAVNSSDGSGIVEDFAVRGRPDLVSATLIEDAGACDADGVVDAGETGVLRVTIRNVGAAALVAPTVTASTGVLGVSFPSGPTATFADLPLFATATADIPVALGEVQPVPTRLTFGLSMREPSSPAPAVVAGTVVEVNLDIAASTASTDDVESPFPVWSATGGWQRSFVAPTHVWAVPPPLGVTDATLTSPPLVVGAGAFSLAFQIRHQFGAGDGVVLEYSLDDSVWTDAVSVATTGYTGTIPGGGGNPLAGRPAWTGNAGYPGFATRTVDFGTAFAGQTVWLRFRLGGDAVSDGGRSLQLDNLAVTAAGTPFPTTTLDDGSCLPGLRPIADAGPDADAAAATIVTLDGTGSSDPDGTVASYHWTQVGGTIVNLASVSTATPHFTAPDFASAQVLTFQLIVIDNQTRVSVPDTVAITVQPPLPTPDAAPPDAGPGPDAAPDAEPGLDAAPSPDAGIPAVEGGGGCCQTGSRSAPGGMILALAVLIRLRRRRRR